MLVRFLIVLLSMIFANFLLHFLFLNRIFVMMLLNQVLLFFVQKCMKMLQRSKIWLWFLFKGLKRHSFYLIFELIFVLNDKLSFKLINYDFNSTYIFYEIHTITNEVLDLNFVLRRLKLLPETFTAFQIAIQMNNYVIIYCWNMSTR